MPKSRGPGKTGRVTPKEFRAVRASLEMTQVELADHLGISVSAVRKYERGARRIPLIVQRFLRLIEKTK